MFSLKKSSAIVLEVLFPSFCYLCSQPAPSGMPLCEECLNQIEKINNKCRICGVAFSEITPEHICGRCRKEKPKFDLARGWVKFTDPASQIIHQFKYQRGFYFLNWIADGLAELYETEFASLDFDLIVPVPLHWKRLIQRGYNQALILAKALARRIKLPLNPSLLKRKINTQTQVGLSINQRKKNLKNAFEVKQKDKVFGKRILVVDDVITTGTTANEVSKALKNAGAEIVGIIAFARA